jgi:predicted aconitase with swiveling domain
MALYPWKKRIPVKAGDPVMSVEDRIPMKPETPREPARAVWAGATVVPGVGAGPLLALDEPLSFWGGYDAQASAIVEQRHPQFGASLRGRTLLMARAKGSSSSSSVLAEAIRNGTGPAAIVMRERDLIVALGCIVASELYGIDVPIAMVDEPCWGALMALPAGTPLRLDAGPEQCAIAAMMDA